MHDTLDMRNPLVRLSVFSFIIHILVLVIAIIVQSVSTPREFYRPTIIDIDIADKASPRPVTAPIAPAEPAEKPQETVLPKTEVKTTPSKPKEATKPKTADKDALNKRISSLEEKIRKKEAAEKTSDRIAALEKKLSKESGKKTATTVPVSEPGSAGDELPNEYKDLIAAKVRSAWTYPGEAPKDLIVELELIIRPNGEITDVTVMKRSGNTLYDNTVLKAIKKASPLPPPPKNFKGITGFKFCPVRCD